MVVLHAPMPGRCIVPNEIHALLETPFLPRHYTSMSFKASPVSCMCVRHFINIARYVPPCSSISIVLYATDNNSWYTMHPTWEQPPLLMIGVQLHSMCRVMFTSALYQRLDGIVFALPDPNNQRPTHRWFEGNTGANRMGARATADHDDDCCFI